MSMLICMMMTVVENAIQSELQAVRIDDYVDKSSPIIYEQPLATPLDCKSSQLARARVMK